MSLPESVSVAILHTRKVFIFLSISVMKKACFCPGLFYGPVAIGNSHCSSPRTALALNMIFGFFFFPLLVTRLFACTFPQHVWFTSCFCLQGWWSLIVKWEKIKISVMKDTKVPHIVNYNALREITEVTHFVHSKY